MQTNFSDIQLKDKDNESTEKIFKNHEIISQLKIKIETYEKNNLPKELKNIEAVKPGSRNIKK